MSFVIRVAISFVLCAGFVGLVGYVAERNSRLGGVLVGMPSVVMVSLVFIALQQGTDASAHAALAATVVFGGAAIFATTFARCITRGAFKAYLFALVGWFVTAAMAVVLKQHAWLSVVLYVPGVVVARIISRTQPTTVRLGFRRSPALLLVQGWLSGVVVALALISSRQLGPTSGGVVASFPVVIGTSMVFFWRRHRNVDALRSFASGVPTGTFASFVFAVVFALVALHHSSVVIPVLAGYSAAILVAVGTMWFRTIALPSPGLAPES